MKFQRIAEEPNKSGKTHLLEWVAEPWYEPTAICAQNLILCANLRKGT